MYPYQRHHTSEEQGMQTPGHTPSWVVLPCHVDGGVHNVCRPSVLHICVQHARDIYIYACTHMHTHSKNPYALCISTIIHTRRLGLHETSARNKATSSACMKRWIKDSPVTFNVPKHRMSSGCPCMLLPWRNVFPCS